MPAVLRTPKSIVIQILVFSDLRFKGDILPTLNPLLYKSSVVSSLLILPLPSLNGCMHKKIVDKYRNDDKRLDLKIADDTGVFLAYLFKRFGRFKKRKRSENSLRMTVGIGRTDIILHFFVILCRFCRSSISLQDVRLRLFL